MKTTIQSPDFKVNEQLNEFILEKANKLPHLYADILSCDVILKLEKSDEATNKICEIKLALAGEQLFAKSHSKTIETAIDDTVNALKAQLSKLKTKKTNQDHQK
jgi:ribosomal subunit interface protein